MRIRDRRADDVPEINLVPLIDVILVLIIFFVITTTFDARSVLRVELPRATGEANTGSDSLSLLINAEGRYFVDDREALRTDVESLKRTLLEVAGDDRDRTVLLRADARTPWQAVVTAYDALAQLGFTRVANATAPEAPAASPP
ncbi:biopolymer transport protein ExbD [Luteimonas sp. J16]|jgi:biopolymer transport protein ExbD|uniref:ExbD/TolR family protein n=1 Tax=unclassified Luteimonas TaxID=2629088 RepID=UPI00047E334F|nr:MULTISPECIES: biopolymer transporter ExbD [unclassified Luteimonas]TWG90138.1 biopolymer transport protein ExbD [Luteimonas sp. J16]